MTPKIKIDLNEGIVEVEGDEKLLRDVYNDFKEKLIQSEKSDFAQKVVKKDIENERTKPKFPKRGKKAQNSQKLIIVKDLDLAKKGDIVSLKEFYEKYRDKVKTNFVRNLVFVYYLQEIRGIKDITANHIFTCYKNIAKLRVPVALKQSLIDTSSNRGWIDTSSLENITLKTQGSNYFENDLNELLENKDE